MLNRTNILGLIFKNTIGQDNNEKTLTVWDDNKNIKIGEIEFIENIKQILIRKKYTYCISIKLYLYLLFKFTKTIQKNKNIFKYKRVA